VSEPRTYPQPPVSLTEPLPVLPVHSDCDVCQALIRQRKTARDAGDWSAVTDANVEIRGHHA
jgi:hypothetical protein